MLTGEVKTSETLITTSWVKERDTKNGVIEGKRWPHGGKGEIR